MSQEYTYILVNQTKIDLFTIFNHFRNDVSELILLIINDNINKEIQYPQLAIPDIPNDVLKYNLRTCYERFDNNSWK